MNKLRSHRETRLLTQHRLASMSRVAPRTIHSIESGNRCRLDVKRRLLKSLGLTWNQLTEVWPDGPHS